MKLSSLREPALTPTPKNLEPVMVYTLQFIKQSCQAGYRLPCVISLPVSQGEQRALLYNRYAAFSRCQ